MEESGGKIKIVVIIVIFLLVIGLLIAGLLYLIFSVKPSNPSNLFTNSDLTTTKYPITTPIDYSKI